MTLLCSKVACFTENKKILIQYAISLLQIVSVMTTFTVKKNTFGREIKPQRVKLSTKLRDQSSTLHNLAWYFEKNIHVNLLSLNMGY